MVRLLYNLSFFPFMSSSFTILSEVFCYTIYFPRFISHISVLCFCCSLSIALMNHSCCPNVIITYRGVNAEVRAVQEISPGEEVSMSLPSHQS